MNLTEQNKLYLILVGFLLILLIAYKLAIQTTVEKGREYRELKHKSLTADELPQEIARLNQELNSLNSSYFNAVNTLNNSHESLIEKLGYIASDQKVTIIEYPPEHTFSNSKVQIETHNVVLKGKFINLLKVLYQLEVKERVGRMVSVNFYTQTNRRTKVKSLYMQLYIQNYRNQ